MLLCLKACGLLLVVIVLSTAFYLTDPLVFFSGLVGFILLLLMILTKLPVRQMVTRFQSSQVKFFAEDTTQQKKIAITFDDGPDPGKTEQILSVLAKHRVHASFFVVGERLEQHPQLARSIAESGHLLCNHHWRDEATAFLSPNDMARGLEKTDALIRKYQSRARFFRPGSGFYNEDLKRIAAEQGYTIVLGDVYPHDVLFGYWPSLILPFLLNHSHPGSIIILHDKARLPTERTLDMLLTRLSARGFSFCTLEEMFPV